MIQDQKRRTYSLQFLTSSFLREILACPQFLSDPNHQRATMSSTLNQSTPRTARKLIDYTQRGKLMTQDYAAVQSSSSCSASSCSSKREPLPTSSSDSIQSTIDLLMKAKDQLDNQDDEQVEFMLKIPSNFQRREHSDLRERFGRASSGRTYPRRCNRIESTLADPFSRLTRKGRARSF